MGRRRQAQILHFGQLLVGILSDPSQQPQGQRRCGSILIQAQVMLIQAGLRNDQFQPIRPLLEECLLVLHPNK